MLEVSQLVLMSVVSEDVNSAPDATSTPFTWTEYDPAPY